MEGGGGEDEEGDKDFPGGGGLPQAPSISRILDLYLMSYISDDI